MLDKEFERIGKRLFTEGLVGGNFGNMSVRAEGGMQITLTGSYLDVAQVPVFVPDLGAVPKEASSEYRVHRAVYRRTPHMAVVHAHPAHAVACSLDAGDAIVPVDSEGQMFCPKIPVVDGTAGSEELAASVAEGLLASKVVIARGHGTFAAGKSLDEAYLFTSIAGYACRVLILRAVSGAVMPRSP